MISYTIQGPCYRKGKNNVPTSLRHSLTHKRKPHRHCLRYHRLFLLSRFLQRKPAKHPCRQMMITKPSPQNPTTQPSRGTPESQTKSGRNYKRTSKQPKTRSTQNYEEKSSDATALERDKSLVLKQLEEEETRVCNEDEKEEMQELKRKQEEARLHERTAREKRQKAMDELEQMRGSTPSTLCVPPFCEAKAQRLSVLGPNVACHHRY